MGLESATTIAELDKTWPLSRDSRKEGDDHLRLLKAVLQTQFPGALGAGYDEPITATESELNFTAGLTGNIQEQIDTLNLVAQGDYLNAPVGTVMIFMESTLPLDWEIGDIAVDGLLRLVGPQIPHDPGLPVHGTDDPMLASFTHSHSTAYHTLTENEMPQHSHQISAVNSGSFDGGGYLPAVGWGQTESVGNTFTKGGSTGHSHGNTGSYAGAWEPRIFDAVLGEKV